MRKTTGALLVLFALLSGCSQSPRIATPEGFDACQSECAALLDVAIPACLSSRRVRNELEALFANVRDIASGLDLPEREHVAV
jgi:hypothetical protein